MSHIEEGRTHLVFTDLAAVIRRGEASAIASQPCTALLRQAVVLVASQHQGTVQSSYENFWHVAQPTNTGLALSIPGKLPRGIGLIVDEQTGALSFKGDPWGIEPAFYQHLQQEIVQKYIVLAYGAALRRARFQQVQVQEQGDQIVIMGVLHG